MCAVELWLGPAGSGKTRQALAVLRTALNEDWRSVRYLVPTVGHKRSIEHLLLQEYPRPGLFGDPVNIFYTFAQEVAQRGGVRGSYLTEMQKHLLLRELIRTTPLDYFARAARFPGFAQALGEAIDELKVHMVLSDDLLRAAVTAGERGAQEFAQKLHELGTLYALYQQRLIAEHLYDNEGMMWLAAECLREQPDLFAPGELRYLLLDGFPRLTPIQLHFLRALAPRVARTIVLFDFEEGRSAAYHPVQSSLDRLLQLDETDQLGLHTVTFTRKTPRTALETLRAEIFRDRGVEYPCDGSVGLLQAATPGHEEEMIAREVRALLRAGHLPDGTPIGPEDIAILARNADHLRERYARTFARFGLTLLRPAQLLAHTSVGRALFSVFRLVRERWKREDVLTLLKSGFLAIDPGIAFQVDIIARTQYLRDRKSTWLERWPDEETREALHAALAPLIAFDEAFHRHDIDSAGLLAALGELLRIFQANALPEKPPLPEQDAEAARRYIALRTSFTHCAAIFDDLQQLGALLGGFRREETLDVVSTALLKEQLPEPPTRTAGIAMRAVHSTGGEKFKVVVICGLLQGDFPRHQRESAFLMDHEREETLHDLNVLIESRKHLENDEQFWFLNALSAATHRVVLSYAQHDSDGRPFERSMFLDEVDKILPELPAHARSTSFRDIVPPLPQAESREEFLAGLAHALRTERAPEQRAVLAAAYAGSPFAHGPASALAQLFHRARGHEPGLTAPTILAALQTTERFHSASELQGYVDCPFSWFGGYGLRVGPVVEEFSPLDRGVILHGVLENLYRSRQQHPGEPVVLNGDLEEIWPQVEADLFARLQEEPRFLNRPQFLRDIEWESMRRMMRRFLRSEIDRAQTRRIHPAFFEINFGDGRHSPLALGDGSVRLRGKLDRVDLVDDNLGQAIVIDYKSSARMSLKDLQRGKVLQASVYALALQRVFGLDALGAEFLGLKEGDGRGIYRDGVKDLYGVSRGLRELDAEQWHAFLAQSEATLCTAAEGIRQGCIDLRPTTDRCGEGCDYFALCRGNRFDLARLQRISDSVDPPPAE